MKPLIYVAGPYTNPDPVINTRRACLVGDELIKAGAAVFIPHLSLVWHLVSPASVEEWYLRDLDMLDHCDALVRFYGESVGANREWEYADGAGIERWALGQGHDTILGSGLREWIREFETVTA